MDEPDVGMLYGGDRSMRPGNPRLEIVVLSQARKCGWGEQKPDSCAHLLLEMFASESSICGVCGDGHR